jgi:TPR repeat protein
MRDTGKRFRNGRGGSAIPAPGARCRALLLGAVLVSACDHRKSSVGPIECPNADDEECCVAVDREAYACRRGDADACELHGIGHEIRAFTPGADLRKHEKRAYAVFARGCDLGNGNACWRALGAASHVDGLKLTDAQALAMLEKGCDEGAFKACEDLGWSYEAGHHGVRDPLKARAAYVRACDLEGRDGAACEHAEDVARRMPKP